MSITPSRPGGESFVLHLASLTIVTIVERIRVHDPERRPPSWTDIIRPGQFVAFAKFLDGGGSCDADGRPFATPSDTSCVLFDTIDEAASFCTERAKQHPGVSFEIFDSAGRVNPPLIVVVDPSRATKAANNPRSIRLRQYSAIGLILCAVALFWVDYSQEGDLLILPTIVGVNMLLAAGRLLQMTTSMRAAERERQERLARARHSSQHP